MTPRMKGKGSCLTQCHRSLAMEIRSVFFSRSKNTSNSSPLVKRKRLSKYKSECQTDHKWISPGSGNEWWTVQPESPFIRGLPDLSAARVECAEWNGLMIPQTSPRGRYGKLLND